ncbi:MAG: NADH:ubiquinone reductase (Na(+)-transporting) subunit D [Planctomycetota bacterium]
MKEGLWENNPISVQILGICSALAITNTLANSLVMGAALVFVGGAANLVASALRDYTPGRIRLIVEMAIIATLVILVDQFLKGFYWDMSKRLGPYVGLIITNCIVLGRVEAFSLQNPPMLSVVDGVANGLGYAAILAIIGLFRELLGSGEVFGFTVLSADWYPPNQLMILAPGAFLGLGFLIALFNVLHPPEEEEE